MTKARVKREKKKSAAGGVAVALRATGDREATPADNVARRAPATQEGAAVARESLVASCSLREPGQHRHACRSQATEDAGASSGCRDGHRPPLQTEGDDGPFASAQGRRRPPLQSEPGATAAQPDNAEAGYAEEETHPQRGGEGALAADTGWASSAPEYGEKSAAQGQGSRPESALRFEGKHPVRALRAAAGMPR